MELFWNLLTGALILFGAFFVLAAAIGIVRMPDFYTRMHAASKAGTVGSCVMLLAMATYAQDNAIALRAIAGIAFFLLTAPISAHLLAKAAYAAGYPLWDKSIIDDMHEKKPDLGGRY